MGVPELVSHKLPSTTYNQEPALKDGAARVGVASTPAPRVGAGGACGVVVGECGEAVGAYARL